jgi:peroxiredoxin
MPPPLRQFFSIKKKIGLIYFLPVISLMISCTGQTDTALNKQFTLTGKTYPMPDSTMLYLTETLSNQIIDSTWVIKNEFQFHGKLTDSPTNFYLHTKDLEDYVSLWIEQGKMTFDASAVTAFKNATITGSKTHAEAKSFLDAIAAIENEDDMEETERLAIEFIKTHPENRLSVSMLAGYSPNLSIEKVKLLYDPFSQENKESAYGKRILQYITLYKEHKIGDPYSDFEMENSEGQVIKLSDHLGKVTLLEFWASWCGPCRERSPELRAMYQKYNVQGFEIIGISLDFSKEDWTKAIASDSLKWLHVSDLKGRNSLAGIMYGVNAIPDNFLIGRDGTVIGKYLWGDELDKAIEKDLE